MLPRRGPSLFCALFALVTAGFGCAGQRAPSANDAMTLRDQLRRPMSPKQAEAILQPRALSSIGDMAIIQGLEPMPVLGIGLVTGLGDKGSDKASVPDEVRKEVVKSLMRDESRSFAESWALVKSRDTSIVQVSGAIPAGAGTGFLLDVYIRPLDSAVSLDNGYLHQTPLRKFVTTEEGTVTGDTIAYAEGAVTTAVSSEGTVILGAGGSREGVVFDGGKYQEERILIIMLKDRYVSGNRAVLIEYLLNRRFGTAGVQPGLPPMVYAEAVSNRSIFVRVPGAYRRYAGRFADVVRDTRGSYYYGAPPASALKGFQASLETGDPKSKYAASVELEAVGAAAVPYLEEALGKGDDWTKLYAGEALSYLNRPKAADSVLAAASAAEEQVRFEAVRFLGQVAGRPTIETLRQKVFDPSGRVAAEAVSALLMQGTEAADRVRLAYFDLVMIPGGSSGLLVKESGRPMVVISGSGSRLKGTVEMTVAGVGLGSVDDSHVGIVAGSGARAQAITVNATVDDVLTAIAHAGPPFDTMKKIIAGLEDRGNLPQKVIWLR